MGLGLGVEVEVGLGLGLGGGGLGVGNRDIRVSAQPMGLSPRGHVYIKTRRFGSN